MNHLARLLLFILQLLLLRILWLLRRFKILDFEEVLKIINVEVRVEEEN